jgi:hypothetical protein
MIPKKHAPDLRRSGNRFSDKIMLTLNSERDDDPKKVIALGLRPIRQRRAA